MHPIVLISSDKDPAIGKAVDLLQDAGFEVRVLNSATAKLVDFLGALAGADDEEEAEPKAPEDEQPSEKADKEPKDDAPADDEDPLDPTKMEALVSNERVIVEIVDGAGLTLHPSSVTVAARTVYTLNESQYAFWPAATGNDPIFTGVDLELEGATYWVQAQLSETTANPPVLKIGRAWLKEARERRGSWAIMKSMHIEPSSPTIEDIRRDHGACTALLCAKDEAGSLMWLMSSGEMSGVKVGSSHAIHADQTGRDMGMVTVVAIVNIADKKDGDKLTGKNPKGKDLYATKATGYVFK
jgi:hypothetical protein